MVPAIFTSAFLFCFIVFFYYRLQLDKTCHKLREKHKFKYTFVDAMLFSPIFPPALRISYGNVVSINQMIGIMMGSIAVFGIIYYVVTLLSAGEGRR